MNAIIMSDSVEQSERFNDVIEYYNDQGTFFLLDKFMRQVRDFFEQNPILHENSLPAVHSVKARHKDPSHLLDKLQRKAADGIFVTKDTLFNEITDLIGVRVLHLYQEQFEVIHREILEQINNGDWILGESPKAYTWDPETQKYFNSLEVSTEIKESYYTSVHYLIKPNNKRSNICCEVQVRTLFEEIWGEIDHTINYPHKTDSVACAEQIKVLSYLISTGTKLSDSIFKSYKEYIDKSKF